MAFGQRYPEPMPSDWMPETVIAKHQGLELGVELTGDRTTDKKRMDMLRYQLWQVSELRRLGQLKQ